MAQKYKIGVLCQYPFPVGMAPTTRIISYGTGLIQNGADVEVYTFYWRGDNSDEPLEGEINGVKFFFPCRYHTRKGRLYHSIIDKHNIFHGTLRKIKESNRKKPFDYFLISFDKIAFYSFFLPRISLMRIPMALISDEFPEPIRMLKKDVPLWDKVRLKFYNTFFRKRILMTRALVDFYNKEISYKPYFILNSVLDESRFEGISREKVDRKYLCYMGNMQLKKDNVDNIIKAFSLIASDFPEYDLYLFGSPNAEDGAFVKQCIAQNGMQGRVIMKGRIDYADVPQTLANATVLVTSQPDTLRAQGGFPTKMGEYMMSHTPMLVTDVGEIHLYVQDGINTFMVPPCNPQAYAEKLRYILEHPDVAQRVADSAYKYAINNFTAQKATEGVLPFLLS